MNAQSLFHYPQYSEWTCVREWGLVELQESFHMNLWYTNILHSLQSVWAGCYTVSLTESSQQQSDRWLWARSTPLLPTVAMVTLAYVCNCRRCVCFVYPAKLAVTCLTSLLIHINKKICFKDKGCSTDTEGEPGWCNRMCFLSKQVAVISVRLGSRNNAWHKTLSSPPPHNSH